MMKKLIISTLTLCITAFVGATELDLDLSSLSVGETGKTTYNTSSHVISFANDWSQVAWWVATYNSSTSSNENTDYSAYNEFVLEYSTETENLFRISFSKIGVDGAVQEMIVRANSSFGRAIIKLNDNAKQLSSVAITAAGNAAFEMTLAKAYFRSTSGASTTQFYTTPSVNLSNWEGILNLSGNNKPAALSSAKVGDEICVTLSSASSGNSIVLRNSSHNSLAQQTATVKNEEQTIYFAIPNAAVLEEIQLNGIIFAGCNATISSVGLVTYTESYDAASIIIGEEGKRTYSTQGKILNFSGTGIIPYYIYPEGVVANSGQVVLTKTDATTPVLWNYCGAILIGSQGKYEIPVYIRSGDDDYTGCPTFVESVSQNCMKGGGDYSTNVAASTEGSYRYIFAKDGSGNIGFYKLTDTDHTLAAHKAYLETSADVTPDGPGAPAIHLVFDEENGATALEQFEANDEVLKFIENGQLFIRKNGVTYDLMGRTVK